MTDSTRYNIWRWRIMYCWIIAFTAITFFGLHDSRQQTTDIGNQAVRIEKQAASNRRLTKDIQQSRITSCRQTYEVIREVFKPFFRPPKQRTDKEKRDLAKFNKTVNDLKAKCDQQVKPK